MPRIMLVVSYDGTAYHGWQLQSNGATIESVLNNTLHALTGEDIQVIGASRTDAGVHALGNIAVFDTDSKIPPEKFSYALNQRLPADIVVQNSVQVANGFHPRHHSSIKTYEYTILNRRFPLPEYRNTAYFYSGTLFIPWMQEAAGAFLGKHDFSAFCAAGAQTDTTVRTIYALDVRVLKDDRIKIIVKGNGFLYNMVRIIAGTLLEVGKGNIAPGSVPSIINSCDRTKAGPTAPACGLRLVEIEFK